jgi:hypothetical protein
MAQLFEAGLFVTLVNQVCAHAGIQNNRIIANFIIKGPPGRLSPVREVTKDARREVILGIEFSTRFDHYHAVYRGYIAIVFAPQNRKGKPTSFLPIRIAYIARLSLADLAVADYRKRIIRGRPFWSRL